MVRGPLEFEVPGLALGEGTCRRSLDCICNGGFRPFSRFASGHLPYSVDLLRPALCLPLRISLRNLVYEVISTSDGCLIFLEGTRRRRGCAEAGGWGRGNILLAELQIHSIHASSSATYSVSPEPRETPYGRPCRWHTFTGSPCKRRRG